MLCFPEWKVPPLPGQALEKCVSGCCNTPAEGLAALKCAPALPGFRGGMSPNPEQEGREELGVGGAGAALCAQLRGFPSTAPRYHRSDQEWCLARWFRSPWLLAWFIWRSLVLRHRAAARCRPCLLGVLSPNSSALVSDIIPGSWS